MPFRFFSLSSERQRRLSSKRLRSRPSFPLQPPRLLKSIRLCSFFNSRCRRSRRSSSTGCCTSGCSWITWRRRTRSDGSDAERVARDGTQEAGSAWRTGWSWWRDEFEQYGRDALEQAERLVFEFRQDCVRLAPFPPQAAFHFLGTHCLRSHHCLSRNRDPSGRLNFSSKAVLHADGVDFSSGQSYKINMSELELEQELGKGQYGTVQRVFHKPTKVIMAMKVRFSFYAFDPSSRPSL
jgi:hypothetical protein